MKRGEPSLNLTHSLFRYGGPDHNMVSDKLHLRPGFVGYGQHGIVHVDVRGSGGRGWKYRSPIYGQIGKVEMEDTLEAIK